MSCFYSPLQQEALLHIEGPDSLTFLQGQTTCDTRHVTATDSVQGAYCTPKGRVVCDFLLHELAKDHFALRLRRDIREHSAAVFGKYIVFSKAQLDSNDNWQVTGIWGETAADALAQTFGSAPNGQMTAVTGDGFKLVQVDTQRQQFECYITSRKSSQLEILAGLATLSDEQSWQALQIDAGWGRICAATVEEFLPQVLNYDITGHVNFKKGCYTGQEVVARLHYRGKSKRRLYRVLLPENGHTLPAAAPGEPLFTKGTAQSIGNVVNSVTSPSESDTQARALLVATAEAVASGLYLGDSAGEPMGDALTLLELPYAVEPA